MEKANLPVTFLAGLGLVGVFVLLGLGKSVEIVLPVVSVLCGAAAGLNAPAVLGAFKSKK